MVEKKPLILVVDDEEVNVRFLKAVLTRRGYEVEAAYDGKEAIEMFEYRIPDLVLLDVMMPGMDGFEVCRRIKGREETHFVPVVMVTALDTTQDRIQGIDAGVDDFLTKPIQIEELLARVRSCLKNRQLFLQLESAYKQLSGLTRQTDQILKEFNPMRFDVFSTENQLFDSLVRAMAGDEERPSQVILGVPVNDSLMECRLYRRIELLSTLSVQVFTLNRKDIKPLLQESGIFYANFGSDDTISWLPPDQLLQQVGELQNLVSFSHERFLLAGINYGRSVSRFDAQVLKGLALHQSFFDTIASQIQEVENAFRYMIDTLARASEANDEDTGVHIHRIKEYTALVGGKLGLPTREVDIMSYSALMHDVGKIHIHPDILRKPGRLTPEEFQIIKKHTVYGALILGDSSRLAVARRIALSHHERWDGTGYPDGLKGENIPLEGRIVSIGDVYDALRSQRPYKPSFSHDRAVEIILKGDGRTMPDHFDPQVREVFRANHRSFEEIFESLKDEENEQLPTASI